MLPTRRCRAGRRHPAPVTRKLERYERATRPIVAHSRGPGAAVLELPVTGDTGEDDIVRAVLRASGADVRRPANSHPSAPRPC